MRKDYSWLWFDADGTLFDFYRAEGIALKRAFGSVSTPFEERYLEVYRRINQQLWDALEQHTITSEVLRIRRFEMLLEAAELSCSADEMSVAYMEHLAACSELIEGADEVVCRLRGKYRLAIVTNGLQTVQRSRLAGSPIREYISELIISEEVGAAKPKAEFFDAAFARAGNPAKRDVLIIGDSLSADMQGGVAYGIDTCWYNPAGVTRPGDLAITYEIARLEELLTLID